MSPHMPCFGHGDLLRRLGPLSAGRLFHGAIMKPKPWRLGEVGIPEPKLFGEALILDWDGFLKYLKKYR